MAKKKPTQPRKDKKSFVTKIDLPKGVSVHSKDEAITIKGPKGEVAYPFNSRRFNVSVDAHSITIDPKGKNQRDKMQAGTFEAHIRNMVKGVQTPYVYTLKICSGHFPITVTVSGDKLTIKNFFGEKVARIVQIKKGATVKVEGEKITVEGPSIDVVGQVSADIEQATRRANFDTRIFQDGIYITSKNEQ